MNKINKTKDGRHHFKWMKFKGRNVRIDVDIASLISNMWKLGINTINSCQADHDLSSRCCNRGTKPTKLCSEYIWLVFETSNALETFLNIVAEYSSNKDDMYHHIHNAWYGRRDDKKDWTVKAHLHNYGELLHFGRPTIKGKRTTQEQIVFDGCGKNNFIMEPQLSFPREHLPYVEQKIQEALNKKLKRKKKK